jgi:hypothetical protein
MQPSDFDGPKERLWDAFLPGRDSNPLLAYPLRSSVATNVTLEYADSEVAFLRVRLAEADRRVVG